MILSLRDFVHPHINVPKYGVGDRRLPGKMRPRRQALAHLALKLGLSPTSSLVASGLLTKNQHFEENGVIESPFNTLNWIARRTALLKALFNAST
jgi:hypothetical protein